MSGRSSVETAISEKLSRKIITIPQKWCMNICICLKTKKGSILNVSLEKNNKKSFDDKANANTFKELFCNLASDLVVKLPSHSYKFGITSLRH